MSLQDILAAKKVALNETLRPKTLREPDRDTFYCDIRSKRFSVSCCKILEAYANGDCRVLMPNGIQFTAIAEEVFHIRKGDYHESFDA